MLGDLGYYSTWDHWHDAQGEIPIPAVGEVRRVGERERVGADGTLELAAELPHGLRYAAFA